MTTKTKTRPKAAHKAPPPKPKPRTKPKAVGYIAILTDASGSMERLVEDTVGAFNGYLAETAKAMKDQPVTLQVFQFSGPGNWSGHLRLIHGGRIGDGFKMSRENYVCGGNTPLIDASCDVIDQAKADFAARKIVVIQTDGEENMSTRFTKDDLRQRIAKAEEAGWQIIFLGNGIDGFAEASKFGKVSIYNTVSVPQANLRMFGTMTGAKSANYFASGQNVGYTTADRTALGEASLTGAAASNAAGAAADALEVNVTVKKPIKR